MHKNKTESHSGKIKYNNTQTAHRSYLTNKHLILLYSTTEYLQPELYIQQM